MIYFLFFTLIMFSIKEPLTIIKPTILISIFLNIPPPLSLIIFIANFLLSYLSNLQLPLKSPYSLKFHFYVS